MPLEAESLIPAQQVHTERILSCDGNEGVSRASESQRCDQTNSNYFVMVVQMRIQEFNFDVMFVSTLALVCQHTIA